MLPPHNVRLPPPETFAEASSLAPSSGRAVGSLLVRCWSLRRSVVTKANINVMFSPERSSKHPSALA